MVTRDPAGTSPAVEPDCTKEDGRISVTLPKSPVPVGAGVRKRGRPRKPDALDAAEKMARSRERKAHQDACRMVLIAAMAKHLSAEQLQRFADHGTFGPILEEARVFAQVLGHIETMS